MRQHHRLCRLHPQQQCYYRHRCPVLPLPRTDPRQASLIYCFRLFAFLGERFRSLVGSFLDWTHFGGWRDSPLETDLLLLTHQD